MVDPTDKQGVSGSLCSLLHKRCHFEGNVSNVTRAKFYHDVDNDGHALRDGQVMESFTTQSEALPVPTASTWSELQNAPAP